ncbi:TetR/AcrR family transcriptional regulator [Nocardia brasiliensis]|uniref:TetR/AcrR family transcriptional regulator n=1 Tax=Nocardia brasiliensis TaxID=37326 RepID=UPI0004A6FA2A|nr:TetR/AcrR family transcriptional regulator [Nocardia brasiliensis]MBF6127078.1 TetR/AcrR family transcriptional regulator [Nocardia brasiliensis]MBF6548689.1 TetR/AcrR family transcriptional regulator [Nocardia brasiliensis]
MVTAETNPVRSAGRRHGAALEAAILDAGWDELTEVGYARLTMGSIAKRAHTSEPVLYRRWANKDELVLAVLDRYRATHAVAVPDTGNLRDDLIQYLTALSKSLAGYFAITAAASLSGLLAATGMSPAQIRERAMGGQALPQRRTVYRQAAARGELEGVPAAVLAVPFDLVRHDLLMDLEPPGPERIHAIVEEIFLPLVRAYRPG